jgi:glycosyltransferase involved in cell wall biosynthesis
MAERVTRTLPDVRSRLVVRMHPVSASLPPRRPVGQIVLCPVIFESYKHMTERLADWVAAVGQLTDQSVRLLVTAGRDEVPASLARSPQLEFTGRLSHGKLRHLWARSRAVYFPPGLESFGCPLAEARVYGMPVIARATAQSREIAGPALCGFDVGDADSLRQAIELALTAEVSPDPAPFDPTAYFDWMLGPQA